MKIKYLIRSTVFFFFVKRLKQSNEFIQNKFKNILYILSKQNFLKFFLRRIRRSFIKFLLLSRMRQQIFQSLLAVALLVMKGDETRSVFVSDSIYIPNSVPRSVHVTLNSFISYSVLLPSVQRMYKEVSQQSNSS